jgi:hypothetical protein
LREGKKKSEEVTSYRPVTRKVALPELNKNVPGLDYLLRHKKS